MYRYKYSNVTCTGALACDPSPSANIPDPVVEITYIGPKICGTTTDPPYHYCMYTNTGSSYDVACGWTWNIMVPANQYNCEIFTYWLQWIESDNSGCDSTCASIILTPGMDYCIDAKIGQPIWVVADGNHCCVPAGYQRAYVWNPVVNGGLNPIAAPVTTIGSCTAYRCPRTGSCTESQQTMNINPITPYTMCFKGGGTKFEQRINRTLFEENSGIEQNVKIYDLQGKLKYDGRWVFGTYDGMNIHWPGELNPGLYLVKFQNTAKLIKLFKLN